MTTPDMAAETRSGSITILLVDDEPAVRLLTQKFLKTLGYHVLVMETAQEALSYVTGHSPLDLLISDVTMPGMSGHELVTRATKIRPTLRHLFISGHSHNFYAKKGLLEKEVPFLLKPFSRTALGEKVHEILTAPVNVSE